MEPKTVLLFIISEFHRISKLNKSVITIVFALSLMLGSFSLSAQSGPAATLPENVPALLAKVNESYAAKDYQALRSALERINELRPNNSEYMYRLVIAYALLDEKSKAYDLMLRMQQQGLNYDFMQTEDSMNIRGTEVFDFVNDLMIMAGNPVGESEAVFTLPGSIKMPEAIAWDESRQKFLIGTLTDGRIIAVDKDGQVTELLRANAENGMGSVFDVLADQQRNRLWVSSSATPAFSGFDPADKGRAALYEFNLETLELINRHPVPVDGRAHILGSMAINPAGDIYIVDRLLPILYKKPADEQNLVAVLASRKMISMRGVTMQPDGSLLYVADRELGILVVDTVQGLTGKLQVPDTLNIGGIDGLYMWNNNLVMIQNGISPQRVMRLQLDPSGTQVTSVRPLAVAQPEFDIPNYGTLQGEDIYYFANTQLPADKGAQKPVTVLRTPLDSSADLVQPDMMEYFKTRGEKPEAQQKNEDGG